MQFPESYKPAWWPAEDVVADMVQTELDECEPGGVACTWINKDDAETIIAAGGVVVRIHAMPGTVQERVLRYVPVQMEVLAARRSTSQATFEYLSDVLCEKYRNGGKVMRADSSITPIREFKISETPQQVVFVDPDDRVVQGTFVLTTGKRTP